MTKRGFLVRAVVVLVSVASASWGAGALTMQREGSRVYESREEGVVPPQVASSSKPEYTARARQAGIQGTVLLAVVVSADGTVGDVEVTRSLDQEYGLDEQAVKSAKQWRFRPGTKDGKPVAVRVALEFSFTLRD